MGNYLK